MKPFFAFQLACVTLLIFFLFKNLSIKTIVSLLIAIGILPFLQVSTKNISDRFRALISSGLFKQTAFVLLFSFVAILANANAISITANTNWSAINTGSGAGGQPSATDDITVSNNVTLTVNVAAGVCKSITLGNAGINGNLKFNAASKITVSGNLILATIGSGSNAVTMTLGGTLVCQGISLNAATAGSFTQGTGSVQLTATNTLPSSIFTTFNNLQINAGTTTLGTNVAVAGTLTVPTGATFATASTFTLDVTGATSVTGTLLLVGTGTKTFTGNVTVNAGGVWNETGVAAINYGGNLANSGTYTANTGTHTFTGAAKTLSGTIAISNLAISGTATNSGTLTVSTSLTGAGTLTNGANRTLNFGGTSIALTTLTATAAPNTVIYTGTGQTLKVTAYNNLTLSGGAETFGAITTITGNLALSGTATATTAANLTIGGNLTAGTGTTFTVGADFTLAVTGTTSVTGTLVPDGIGAKTFTGNVTVNAGGVWNETGAGAINYAGNLVNNSTYTASTGIHTFSGAAKTISGSNAVAIPNLAISGTITNNGTLTVATSITGAGTLTNASTGKLNYAGSSAIIPALNATTAGNIVTYNGVSGTQTVKGTAYYDLQFTGGSANTIATGISVARNLTLSGTATVTTADNMTIGGILTVGAGTTFTTGANFTLAVTGTTLVAGTLTLDGTGAKTFTGNATINAGGLWNETGAGDISYAGNLLNNGTYTTNTGVHSFTGAAKTIGGTGTVAIANLTISGTTTNNGTLTVSTTIGGTGTLTNGATGKLNYAGASITPTLTATGVGNIVTYTGTGQTLKVTAYYDLTLSGGAETFGGITTVARDLTLSGTATATTGANLAIGRNLTVPASTTFTTGANFTLGVTGTTSVTGTLTLDGTGTKTFTGNTTINAGGLWNETGIAAINYAGNLLNNGTYTTNTGVHSFTGAAKTIGGANTVVIANLTISGTTTNNGTLTVSTTIAGASTLTNGSTGILNYAGASITPTLTATAIGNTVNYTGTGQTLKVTAYYDLLLSGGAETFGAITTVARDLTLSGTASATTAANLTITRNLTIATGTAFTTGATFTLRVTGNTLLTGTLTLGGTGAKVFTGDVTVNAGSVWNETGIAAITHAGNLQNNGTYTTNTGIHTFSGTAKFISGTNAVAIPNLTISGTPTNNGTLTVSTAIAGAGILTNGATGTLNYAGTTAIAPTLTAVAVGNNVNYNRAGGTQIVKATAYDGLQFTGSSVNTMTAGTSIANNFSISGTTTASLGAGVNINAGTLTLGGLNKINGTWGSTSSSATNKTNTYFTAGLTGIVTVANYSRPTPTFTGLTASQSITYGIPTITLSGTVSATGPVYPVNGGTVAITINGATQNATISGGAGAFSTSFPTATIPVTGSPFTITYAFAGDAILAAAANNTSTTLTVNTAALTITAITANKIYGAILTGAAGSTDFTTSSLQNSETVGTVTIAYGTGAAATDAAGTYTAAVIPSAATGGTFTPANYTITYAKGDIIVGTAPLNITANDQSKNYGTTFTFAGTEFTSSGLLNSDAVSSVTLTSAGAISTATVAGSPYTIVPSVAIGTGMSNYSITYVNGTLTISAVTQANADFQSKTTGNFSASTTWEYDANGTWTNATQAPLSTNNINILSGHVITLDQDFTEGAGKTLLIKSGGSIIINPLKTLDVAATGTINFNGQPVTIKSTATGTGSIGIISGTLSGATNVTAERYINTSNRSWRLLTIPVTGQTIRQAWGGVAANPNAPSGESAGSGTLITGNGYTTGATAAAAGFDWFTGLSSATTSSIRSYNPVTNNWASANTPNPLAAPGKEGYMFYIRGDRTVADATTSGTTTLRPTGTLKHGTITVPVNDAFTVVGNPYAASINLDDIYNKNGNSDIINRNFYVFDATQGTSGFYRNISWDGFAYSEPDYLIVNSGQAFFVEKNGGGNITIDESNKTSTAPQTVFRPMGTTSTVSSLNIKLYQASGSTLGLQTDGTVARYNDIYNAAPTDSYDAAKLNNFNENISLVRNNRYMSVESRPFPTQKDTLFVPFWNLKIRDYALTITSKQFSTNTNQTAILIDKFTNTQKLINLNSATTTYPFTITSNPASSSLNRFMIVMAPAVTLPITFTKINAAVNGSKVQVTWSTGNGLGVKNYDVEKSADGISFSKTATVDASKTGVSYQWLDDQPITGNNFYRIRSNDESGKYVYSSIAEVQLNGKKGIEVTPTIISNQRFTLSLNSQQAGNYRLLLTNSTGQQVYQKVIINSNGNNKQVVELGNTPIAAGIYNLSVTDDAGSNKQNFRLVIQK